MSTPMSIEQLKVLTHLYGETAYLEGHAKGYLYHCIIPCVIRGEEELGFKFNISDGRHELVYGEGQSDSAPFYETLEDAIAAGEKVVADKLYPEYLEMRGDY